MRRAAPGQLSWLIGVVAAAWLVTGLLDLRGAAGSLHHDRLLSAGGASSLGILAFVGGWQLMTAAMMLPSSLPIVRHVRANSVARRRHRGVLIFLVAYFAVWTAFALAMLLGDQWLHGLARTWSLLGSNAVVIPGIVLAVAAAWQLSPLKRACLKSCRPRGYLPLRGWRADIGVFRLGTTYGATCVGSCWAMMLAMFAAGVGHLGWMASITAATFAEKNLRQGPRISRQIGAGFAGLAALTLLAPVLFGHR